MSCDMKTESDWVAGGLDGAPAAARALGSAEV